MPKLAKQYMVFLVISSLVLVPFGTGALAQSQSQEEKISAGKMVIDVLLIRPLGIVATVAGSVLFVVSLPFSALGGNVKKASKKLVVEPAKYTFVRALGDF
jgi:hypothetical protein